MDCFLLQSKLYFALASIRKTYIGWDSALLVEPFCEQYLERDRPLNLHSIRSHPERHVTLFIYFLYIFLSYLLSTFEQFCENFLYIEPSFCGDFPAVDIKLLLILLEGPFGWDVPLILLIYLVADDHENDLVQVEVIVYVRSQLLARRIHASTSR